MKPEEFKVIKGIMWSCVSDNFTSLVQLVFTVILARVLAPEAFGIFAMAFTIIYFFSLFVDAGLGYTLIQGKHDENKMANIVFFNGLIISTILFVINFVIAPYIASYFNQQEVVLILRVLGIFLLLSAFILVQKYILRKRLEFKKLFYINSISSFASYSLAVILALTGKGVWALVVGFLLEPFFKSLLVWITVKWRPTFNYDLRIAKKMMHFSSYATLEVFFGWFINGLDKVFLGRFLGSKILGIYNVGYNFAMSPIAILAVPFNTVFYPALCRIQDDVNELRRYYLQYLSWIIFLLYPICLSIFFLAPFLISFFLGHRWMDAIIVIKIMAIQCFIASLVAVDGEFFRARNRPDISAKFFIVRILITAPAYFYFVRFGLYAFTVAYLSLSLVFAPINAFICNRMLRTSFKDLWSLLKSFIAIANIIITILIGFAYYLFFNSFINTFTYLLIVFTIVFVYFVVVLIVDKEKTIKLKYLFTQYSNFSHGKF